MTHHPIKVLEDGTRVYSNGARYTPRKNRVNKVRRPDDPRAVRYGNRWFLPIDTLPDDARSMPDTRPDTDAYFHVDKPRRCKCNVCRRPESKKWKLKRRREIRGTRSVDPPP
jgi:hypothetical protein